MSPTRLLAALLGAAALAGMTSAQAAAPQFGALRVRNVLAPDAAR